MLLYGDLVLNTSKCGDARICPANNWVGAGRWVSPHMNTSATAAEQIEPLLYDRKTTAKLLSVSVRSVDYMVQTGKLKHRRIGSRVLIPATQVGRMAEVGCPYGVTSSK